MKRQIAALLMGAALCAVMPAAAENMRIGDQAVVTKEKEDAICLPIGWKAKRRAARRSPSPRRSATTSICF